MPQVVISPLELPRPRQLELDLVLSGIELQIDQEFFDLRRRQTDELELVSEITAPTEISAVPA